MEFFLNKAYLGPKRHRSDIVWACLCYLTIDMVAALWEVRELAGMGGGVVVRTVGNSCSFTVIKAT